MGITFETRQFNIEDYTEMREMFKLASKEVDSPFPVDVNLYHYLTGVPKVYLLLADGVIKGYAIFRIENHPHYNKPMAFQDVIFVSPFYREGMTGVKFYKYIEKEIEKTKAEAILVSHTVQKDLGSLFKRLGYKPLEVTYIKEI